MIERTKRYNRFTREDLRCSKKENNSLNLNRISNQFSPNLAMNFTNGFYFSKNQMLWKVKTIVLGKDVQGGGRDSLWKSKGNELCLLFGRLSFNSMVTNH